MNSANVFLAMAALVSADLLLLVKSSPFRGNERTPHHPKREGALKSDQRVHPASDGALVQVWTQGYTMSEWDVVWYGNISIGTPPQQFTLFYNTYYGGSWVASSLNCIPRTARTPTALDDGGEEKFIGGDCGTNNNSSSPPSSWSSMIGGMNSSAFAKVMCNGGECIMFNLDASSTYQWTVDEHERPGACGTKKGDSPGVDTFRIGTVNSAQQLEIRNAEFGQIPADRGGRIADLPFDGMLGLGVHEKQLRPILSQAVDQGILHSAVYTLHQPLNNRRKMLFTFGGPDPVNCGPVLEWLPTMSDLMDFRLDSIHMGHTSITANDSVVVVSAEVQPQMPYLQGSRKEEVRRIARAAGAHFNRHLKFYTIACDARYDPLSFVVNRNDYNVTHNRRPIVMTSASLTVADARLGPNECMFAVIHRKDDEDEKTTGAPRRSHWMLGMPFIRQFCTSFDMSNFRVGLASSNVHA